MRRCMHFRRFILLTALCLGGMLRLPPATAQRPTRSTPTRPELPPTERFDIARMLVLAPNGPVLTELRLAVAGRPYRQWIGGFLGKLLDTDSNGALTTAELALLPTRFRALLGLPGSRPLLVPQLTLELELASEQQDSVSVTDFQKWVRSRLPRAFSLIAQPQPADDAIRLSSLLDTDLDGAVAPAELTQATRVLRFRDLDDDETLTLAELLPYRDPLSQLAAITPTVANLPFLHLTDESTAAVAAQQLLRRYGADGQLPTERLRLASDDAAKLPRSSASATELTPWLLTIPVHVTLEFRLSDKANLSELSVQISEAAAGFCQLTSATRGDAQLSLDGLKLVLQARGGGANDRMITRGLLGQQFTQADADRSQSLDESEFPAVLEMVRNAGVTADFPDLDLDADLQLTRSELLGSVEREQAVIASSIEVGVEQEGRTLFSRIDSDADRRLTRRELRLASSTFTELDADQDGKISDMDLQTSYRLTIGLGRSDLRRNDGRMSMQMMQAGITDAILPPDSSLAGPVWFQRMDRNRDGDVSAREFPGTPDMFDKLDANHDGLINAAEAQSH
ncbi:MAG: hypothetical protein ACKO2P_14275 [Planctomycetota bacterium]